jgi:hypothetical protein
LAKWFEINAIACAQKRYARFDLGWRRIIWVDDGPSTFAYCSRNCLKPSEEFGISRPASFFL